MHGNRAPTLAACLHVHNTHACTHTHTHTHTQHTQVSYPEVHAFTLGAFFLSQVEAWRSLLGVSAAVVLRLLVLHLLLPLGRRNRLSLGSHRPPYLVVSLVHPPYLVVANPAHPPCLAEANQVCPPCLAEANQVRPPCLAVANPAHPPCLAEANPVPPPCLAVNPAAPPHYSGDSVRPVPHPCLGPAQASSKAQPSPSLVNSSSNSRAPSSRTTPSMRTCHLTGSRSCSPSSEFQHEHVLPC